MPGRMGNQRVTVKNLKVLQVDEANGIVVVKGASNHVNRSGRVQKYWDGSTDLNPRLRPRSQRPDCLNPGCHWQA